MNIGEMAELGLSWLWRASWQASVVAVFVLAAQWLCRTRLAPKWRSALWGLVLVRLMMPVAPESAWSVFNLARRDRLAPAKQSESVAFPSQDWPMPIRVSTRPISLSQSVPVATLPAPASPAKRSPREWRWRAAGLLWAVGALAYGGWLFLGSRVLRRKLRNHTLLADTRILVALEQCRLALGLARAPEVWVTSAVDSPALFGLIRYRLLVPPRLVETLSLAEWRHVFMHELAHVRRWDVQANWMMVGLQGVHWFNPLIWVSFSRMRADRELACDAAALGCCGEDEVPAYGRTLIKLLEGFGGVSVRTGLVGILETKKHIKNRIRMIATFRKSRSWPFLAVFLMAGLCVFAMTDARTRPTDRSGPTAQFVVQTEPQSSGAATVPPSAAGSPATTAAPGTLGPRPRQMATNSFARRLPIHDSPGARRIRTKLSQIVLDSFVTDSAKEPIPLGILLNELTELSRVRDPEHEGVRFVAGSAQEAAQTNRPPNHAASVLASTGATGSELLSRVTVKVSPPLKKVSLAYVIQVVTTVAAAPSLPGFSGLTWTVGDGAVILWPKPKDAEPLLSERYRVDPDTFLGNIGNMILPRLDSEAVEAGAGTRGTNNRPEIESKDVGAFDGPTIVTWPSTTRTVQDYVRRFFSDVTGINFGGHLVPPNKDGSGPLSGEAVLGEQSAIRPMFFNDRTGVLYVRATRQELDLLDHAVRTANWTPARVNVSAKFIALATGRSGTTAARRANQDNSIADTSSLSNILSEAQYRLLQQTLARWEGTRVIAAPSVTTLSGRQLEITVAEEGLSLDILPEVAGDGHEIRMKIHFTFAPKMESRGGPVLPSHWSTNVVVRDGKTAVLGVSTKEQPGGNTAQAGKQPTFTLCLTPMIIDPAGNRVHPDEDAPASPVAPTPKLAPPF